VSHICFTFSTYRYLNFFIANDPVTGALVLSIKGAASPADALSVAASNETQSFLGGEASTWLLACAREVVAEAKTRLKELILGRPSMKVVITGHCLGGGAAVLVHMLLCKETKLLPSSLVRTYVFGSPPVFRPVSALPPLIGRSIFNFVHDTDVVPRVSRSSLAQLCLAAAEVDALTMTDEERSKVLDGSIRLPPDVGIYRELSDRQMAECIGLGSPGMVLRLTRGFDGKPKCGKIATAEGDGILLKSTMLTDHDIENYVQILGSLGASEDRGQDFMTCCFSGR
jgi:hypothetical protein